MSSASEIFEKNGKGIGGSVRVRIPNGFFVNEEAIVEQRHFPSSRQVHLWMTAVNTFVLYWNCRYGECEDGHMFFLNDPHVQNLVVSDLLNQFEVIK